MKQLNTVNIIEIPDTNDMAVQRLNSFPDDAEGNKAAEGIFRKLVAEQTEMISDEDLDACLDDGYFQEGPYYVCIVHSTPEEGE